MLHGFCFLGLLLLHLSSACNVNVAQRKRVTVSFSKSGYTTSTAVNENGRYDEDKNIIVHTPETFTLATWKKDLQREVQDATVRIHFRRDREWRRNGLKLYTSRSPFPTSNPTSQRQLCHTVTGDPSGSEIPDVYNVTCPGRWRYLLLVTHNDNDGFGPVLDFGEVEVYECPDGTFGSECTSCTSRHCQGESDCPADGTCCQGCQDGWTGNTCTAECPSGFFGPGCNTSCGHCSSGPVCDHVTGNCLRGCKAGWRNEKCDRVCMAGSYGPDCTEKCGKCDGVCDSVDGRCPAGCLDGYNGTNCDVSLPTPDLGHRKLLVLIIAVVAVGCTLLFVVAVLLFLFRNRRQLRVNVPPDTNQTSGAVGHQTDHAHSQCRQPNHYEHLVLETREEIQNYDVIHGGQVYEYEDVAHIIYENV